MSYQRTLGPPGNGTFEPVGLSTATKATVAPIRSHNTILPFGTLTQNAGGRLTCGVDAALGKVWAQGSAGLYQIDSLTATNWSALTLPANVSPLGANAKVVTYTPTSGANAGTKLMFLLSWNTSTSRYEVYSAVPGLKTVTPTWSSVLLQLQANAIMLQTAFRACSTGVFVGEYTSAVGGDIVGNLKVYKIGTDGSTVTTVLSIPSGSGATRHIHGIYEDPYNLGTIYITVGDAFSPYNPPFYVYKSTDGGNTFTGVSTLTNGNWQAVGMGFSSDWVWFVGDQPTGAGPYLCDRATMTPRWATTKTRHDRIAVPGGASGRYITDAAFTASSATITSATANFTAQDKGRLILGNNSVPVGTFILSVTNSTTVVLSAALANTLTGQPLMIGGDTFYVAAFCGATDPATGWLYYVANDTSVAGTTAGIFLLMGRDAAPTLLYSIPLATIGGYECFIAGGYLWVDRYSMPLLTAG